MRPVYTLVLIVVHAGSVVVTLTADMTKKQCRDVQKHIRPLAKTSGLQEYSWCVATSSEPIPVSELPGMTDATSR